MRESKISGERGTDTHTTHYYELIEIHGFTLINIALSGTGVTYRNSTVHHDTIITISLPYHNNSVHLRAWFRSFDRSEETIQGGMKDEEREG